MFRGTNNISQNIIIFGLNVREYFARTMSVSQNIVMDFNNVMSTFAYILHVLHISILFGPESIPKITTSYK